MAAQTPVLDSASAAGKLRGKIAVVLGASKSLGRAITIGYAQEGADVVAVARTSSLLDQLADEIRSLGRRGLMIAADVRDARQIQCVADRAMEEFGRIDVLVHAIGGGLTAAGLERPLLKHQLQLSEKGIGFWEIADEDFDSCLSLDLRSVFLCCKYFAPKMVAQGSGSIVVLGSYSGIMGTREWKDAAYQASKGGVHAFVAAIAKELKPHNVAANVLLPGLTLTAQIAEYAHAARADLKPEDCVPAAVLLATQDAGGFTGRFLEANTASPRLPVPAMAIGDVLAGGVGVPTRPPAPIPPPLAAAPPAVAAPRPIPAAPAIRVPAGVAAVTAVEPDPASAGGWRHTFRALSHTNFRLFFLGQGLSLPGTWMQRVAIAWLAYQMTGSALVLGLVEFSGQIPTILFGPFAGMAADRWNRRRLLMWTQMLSMAQAGILATLILAGWIEVWHFVVLSLLLGVLNPFDQTARQSLMLEMVDEEKQDLSSAVGLNSTMQTTARTVGPAAAGLLLAATGAGVCFVINSLSFLPIIVALGLMKLKEQVERRPAESQRSALRESWSAFRAPATRDVLTLLALGSLFGLPVIVLMPIFATEVFEGGPQALGFLIASYGAGALGGAIYLAGRSSAGGLQNLVVISTAIFGVGLVGVGVAGVLWLALLFMALGGFGMMIAVAGANVFLQSSTDDASRGRVLSWYTMALNGPTPFGSLGAGALAATIGAPITIMAGGAACLLGALAIHGRRLAILRLAVRRAHANP